MSDQTGTDDSKLTRTKIGFAEQGRFLTGTTSSPEEDRLPPGQSWVKGFPTLDLGIKPEISTREWTLQIFGAVDAPAIITWDNLVGNLPQVETVVDIHCVTAWSHQDCVWQGVRTADVLTLAKPDPKAKFVLVHCADGYSTNLSLEDFLADDCLIAHTMRGERLELDHGAPARLVIPHLYFWKSAKWVTKIEVLLEDEPGYWELRNYHNRGNPWEEERYGKPIKEPRKTASAATATEQELAPELPEVVAPDNWLLRLLKGLCIVR
ncbi:sulfite oxidase-like oxidoreductase (plasmid) [Pseudomonas silesiensis]|uniref:sulfite oxidase-like oxidoreductase n=1 Tax=Pseudomonas silesiensis TaxID=1853130 RepID=UPI0030D16BE8